MVEKVRCPYCNLQVEPGTIKCPSCGYILEIAEKKEEPKKEIRDPWKEMEELYKKYGKKEKKIDPETVKAWEALEEIARQKAREKAKRTESQKPGAVQPSEVRRWETLEKEMKKTPPEHQVVPEPQRPQASPGGMKEKMKTNGLSTKSYDRKKRFQIEKKVQKKLFFIPLIFSIILVISTILFLHNILTEKKTRIKIDGNFDDWNLVDRFNFYEQMGGVNPNINITSAALFEDKNTVFIYIRVEGNALYGNNINRTDEFFLFFDTDRTSSTGYLVNGIGAEYMVRITGISNRVLSTGVYAYTGTTMGQQHNWNSWQYIGSCASAVHGSEIEVGVSKTKIDYMNAPVHIVANSFTGNTDEISYPLVSGNALLVTEVYELPAIVSQGEVKVETAILKVIGKPEIGKILVKESSSLITGCIEYRGKRYILKYEDNLLQANLGISFADGDHFSIYANPSSIAPGNLFGLTVDSIEVNNGYFWKKSTGTNNRSYVQSPPPSVKIDGAFGEWAPGGFTYDYDDTHNPSIDLRQTGKNVSALDEVFFYIQMAGNAFAGRAVPEHTPDYSGIAVEADSDRDTIPDSLDPLPFDFNNDGILDANTNNDVDGDGIRDYPYGNDYHLNTTIPDDQRFPQEFRGKFISVYIGPVSQPGTVLEGVDYVRVYVDTDGNPATGFGICAGNGAELLLEITGRACEITGATSYEWHGKWTKAGNFPAEQFGKQIEFGGVKLPNPAVAKYYMIATDWLGETDATEMRAGMRAEREESISAFDTNTRVNANTTGWQIWPDLAYSSDGTIYAVWESNETGYYAIYLSKSYDGGLTWANAVKLPASDNGSRPAIAVYGSGAGAVVHVVFEGSALGGGGVYPDLYYSRSTDGGETFTTVVLDSNYYSEDPDICVDALGYVYIVYTNWFLSFDADVKFRVSTDMGQSFGSAVSIASTGYNEYLPAVAVQGSGASSVLHVEYTYEHYNESGNQRYDTDVIYRKVTNAGSSPTVGSPVTVAGTANYSEYCISNSVAVDSTGNIHLVYTYNYTYYDYDVWYGRSTDGGGTFTTVNIASTRTYDEYQPRIALDDANNPHIVWQDNRSGNYDIWYTNSSNNGQSFLPYANHIKVNRDATTQSQACATVLFVNAQNARKELCIAWADRRSGDYDIYIANGTNRVYLSVNSPYGTPSGTGWYNAGTTAMASVQGIVYDSATVRHVCTGFAGTGSAPSSGTTNLTSFAIYKPSSVTFTWRNQYYCQISFTGTDAQHTVNGSYVENATLRSIAGLTGGWAGWCDENSLLYFHYVTSPQQNYTTDTHSWIVTGPITAVIHYSSPAGEIFNLEIVLLAITGILLIPALSKQPEPSRNISSNSRHVEPYRDKNHRKTVHPPGVEEHWN
ncbi:MAG: hypothetical protein N3F63_05005 [Thermoplasmata archaeon]|nr:hypothetical protein [Thermoplasmata archaeon]